MKLQTIFLVGLALSITGCAEKDQAKPENGGDTSTATPAAEALPDTEKEWRDEAFVAHMHRHANHIDELNMALADGDLDAAMTPAYWLSSHDSVAGIPPAWQPYLDGMREAARDVERSTDLESARAASENITRHCQDCHTAAGIINGDPAGTSS